jgi:hypothetical protein
MIILLWVAFELSYDDFHRNIDRIVKVYRNTIFEDRVETRPSFPFRGINELLNYTQIERAAVVQADRLCVQQA